MTDVLLSLGANLGQPLSQILEAFDHIRERYPDAVMSPIYRTEPLHVLDQPDYFNSAVHFRTGDTPEELMDWLLRLELHFGRERKGNNAPRTLDVDIILFGERRLMTETLTLPHPRFRQRRFVLEPAVQIAPQLEDPVTGLTVRDLHRRCADTSRVIAVREDLEAV